MAGRKVRKVNKKELPIGRITDLGIEFFHSSGEISIFSTIEGRKIREDRRLEVLKRIPKYYNRFGE